MDRVDRIVAWILSAFAFCLFTFFLVTRWRETPPETRFSMMIVGLVMVRFPWIQAQDMADARIGRRIRQQPETTCPYCGRRRDRENVG